uniref:NADH dehydrogenase subunit 6 n=1 Tax=Ornithodoros parkeri TaxID=140564 RepID=A0A3G2K008_ORNPR|nr:NADH dehydrogenase subunit 6 [Ornithodoros parkeri]AYN50634.1 NADH dehydrogenase subunit 6 [Ornithodoros parkeri]
MKFMMIMPLLFMSSTHPISMIMIMILTTIYMSILMYKFMKFSWFILIITLLILGGLLVIFLYITSLTPNKKFIFNKKWILFAFPMLLLLKNNNFPIMTINKSQIQEILTEKPLMMLMFMMFYLLISLISIMMIIKSIMAPLKSN